jgi:S-adenosylmethionine:tRNA ribosyltransferase-isomerase
VDASLAFRIESGNLPPDGRRIVRPLVASGDPRDALDRLGHTPLPPYVKRPDRPEDRERYQTVYARERGSIAAPTAGLHFTEDLLARLLAGGVGRAEIVLHVGHGTFQPVKVEDVSLHKVAAERFSIPAEVSRQVKAARAAGKRVVAVGTTTTRALESAAQGTGEIASGDGETSLVITPGFSFQAVTSLLTNFHLPRSSLLLLVCAFAGRDAILGAYAEAVREGYRFYSYGDAMLIL